METMKMKKSRFGASLGTVVVALAMLAAAAVNLYQFAEIDADRPQHLKAIHEYDSFDIVELGLKHSNIRNTLNLFAVVGREAPKTPLVITSPEFIARSSEFRARMIGIGLVSQMELCEIETAGIEIDPSVELETGVFWFSPGHARNNLPGFRWAFATASPTPTRLIQLETPEFDALIIDEDLIAGGNKLCP